MTEKRGKSALELAVEPTAPATVVTSEPVARGEAVLCLDGVDKRYPGVHAVKDVTLRVARGTVHAIVGENGAGKSTLVGMAAGTVTPGRGTVSIGGARTGRPTPDWSRRHGIAIVHQEPALLPDLTVAENMRLGVTEQHRPPAREQNAWAAQQLAPWRGAADVDPRAFVRDLRPDERFIVEIARALAGEPAVLILDEPTEHLLPEGVAVLFAAIRREIEREGAVVYISHRIREVKQVADVVTVLRDGAAVGTLAADELSEDDVVDLIVGRRLGARFPAKPDQGALGDVVLDVRELSGEGFSSVTLQARRGEIIGLAGIDGQGQRETLRALAGLGHVRGEVRVNGQRVRPRTPAAASAAGFAYLPNDRHGEGVLPLLSVEENVMARALPSYSTAGLVRRRAARKAALRAIADYGIKTPSPDVPIESLSGGNQQKVMLSRIMLSRAPVVLADEPTQGVDVGARAEIYRMLRAAADDGACVLAVSSDASELEGLCDRVLVFSRGRIVCELRGDEVAERRITQAAVTATTGRDRDERAQRRAWWAPAARFAQNDIAPSVMLAAIVVALAFYAASENPFYFTTRNFGLMLPLFATMAFFALGQQLVMMTGGIDLSMGSLAGLLVVVASYRLAPEVGAVGLGAGVLVLVGIAAAVGVLHWLMIVRLHISPLMATLATFMGLQGVSLLLREVPGGAFDDGVVEAVEATVGFVPLAAVAAVVVAVALEAVLRGTLFGVKLRGIGSRPAVAEKVGVRSSRVLLAAYVGSALFALAGALMLMPQVGSGNAAAGATYTLSGVAAVVLGGASIFGGRGSFVGAVLGAAVLVQITTVVQFLQLTDYWQQYLLGGLTIVAAAFYSTVRARGARSAGRTA